MVTRKEQVIMERNTESIKPPPEDKQWKEMGVIFGIAFWVLIVFALISNNKLTYL